MLFLISLLINCYLIFKIRKLKEIKREEYLMFLKNRKAMQNVTNTYKRLYLLNKENVRSGSIFGTEYGEDF